MRAATTERMTARPEPKNYLAFIYLLIIILCGNQFLSLGSWTHISGVFNVRDLGNALAIIGVVYFVFRGREAQVLWTSMSLLIVLYLLMILLHIGIASLFYDQPLISGILSARHHFYYLSFFCFLFVLDTPGKIVRFLNLLTLLALVIFVLGIINYLGFIIFDHKWADGHGERGGVTRGFLPAMQVVSVAALWEFSKFAESGKMSKGGFTSLVLLGAHFFRQTRMRTVGLIGVVLILFIRRRQWRTLFFAGLLGFVGVLVLEVGMGKPVVTSQFTSIIGYFVEGVGDSETEGSWRDRLSQLENSVESFRAHPIVGTGSAVLRAEDAATSYNVQKGLAALQYKADLGYASWLKSFGLVGVFWLAAFYIVWWRMLAKARKYLPPELSVLSNFSSSLLLWIAGTFLTLNHFMYVGGMLIVSLGAAVTVRLYIFSRHQKAIIATRNE